jgi:hypothetical protein
MFGHPKRPRVFLAMLPAVLGIGMLSAGLALAKKPPKLPPEPMTNPAFVYLKVWDYGLFLITADGNTNVRLTKPPPKGRDGSPTWSPDPDGDPSNGHNGVIAFLRHHDSGCDLYSIRSDGSQLTLIRSFDSSDAPAFPEPWDPPMTWTADGTNIIYSADDSLWAVDVATGDLQLVFAEVDTRVFEPALSPDLNPGEPGYQGQLAFRASDPYLQWAEIWLLEVTVDQEGTLTTGQLTALTDSPDVWEECPAWSPDGNFLAYLEQDPQWTGYFDIVAINLEAGFKWPVVAFDEGKPSRPSWSSDGQYIGYSAPSDGTYDIFRVDPWDPTAPVVNVTNTDSQREREVDPDWNPAWINDIDP